MTYFKLPSSCPPMPHTRGFAVGCLCLWLVVAGIDPLWAQGVPAEVELTSTTITTDDGSVTQEQVDAAKKATESDTNLDESLKSGIIELYDRAGNWLIEADKVKGEFASLTAQVEGAPARIEELRAALATGVAPEISGEAEVKDMTLEHLELAVIEESAALSRDKDELKKQRDTLAQLLVGAKGLSVDIADRNDALGKIASNLNTQVPNESPAMTQARTLALQARRMLRQAELELLKLRLASINTLTSLARAERDLLEAQIAAREPRLTALKEQAQEFLEKRVRDARREAEKQESRTAALPEAIQTIARENAQFRNELEELVDRENRVIGELEKTQVGLESIESDFERTRQRVDVVGPTEAIGKMLLSRRNDLPSVRSYRRTSAERVDEISRATDRQIGIDELLRERADIQGVVDGVTRGFAPDLPGGTKAAFLDETTKLARNRRQALRDLQTLYGSYISQLTSLDLAERQLVSLSGTFTDYINDQLMWIPSSGIGALIKPEASGRLLLWILSPSNWLRLAEDLWDLFLSKPVILLLLVGLFAVVLFTWPLISKRIVYIGEKTRAIRSDSFLLTVRVLVLTLLIVGAIPLLMVSVGWLLGRLPTAGPFSLLMANGLVKAGLILFSLGFLRQICLPGGLGDRHLSWSQPIRDSLARELGWLKAVVVPLGFLVAVSTGNMAPQSAKILGQLAFIGLMVAAMFFLYRLLHRRSELMKALWRAKPEGALVQLHFIWFSLFMIAPLALAITSALGYRYTALILEQQVETTFWFFVVLFLLRELLLRSLYIAERRLRYQDAVRRRDELRAQREREEQEEEDTSAIQVEIPDIDYDQLGDQAKRLVRAAFLFGAVIGTWLIWSDLLPALGFLNNTELPFQASRIVDGVARDVPVTLGDLVVGLIIVLITVLAAKNLPGILEITLLQRLPLDAGARYAITALSQYLIAGIGIFTAFSTIGLKWSSIQWLVAALSVGLGFGLQEIVANFISGIILLFERPIRVGDRVTISNTTGIVSRIRIRATTITNYDKQELLIPNKQIITGEVINWTLTDKVNRVLITVGVAYGSDVERAMRLLIEAADENPEVLEDPRPIASFEAFGDNALTLFLRAYLGDMDNRLNTITALHQAVNEKFNEAGIEISFPQRDVHFDAKSPLEIRVSRTPK